MTLHVVLHRQDVANGDNNEPWEFDLPDTTRVGHVVRLYATERYLPEMSWCGWRIRQTCGERHRNLAYFVTLDHPADPLVFRLDGGLVARGPLDDPAWRTPDGDYEFHARYDVRVSPLSFDNYRRWTDEEIDW